MSRARDMANLGAQAGSGLDASDITTGTFPTSVIPNLAGDKITTGTLGNTVQDNITRLGNVTTGFMKNTIHAEATFPDDFAIKHTTSHIGTGQSGTVITSTGFNPMLQASGGTNYFEIQPTMRNSSNDMIVIFTVGVDLYGTASGNNIGGGLTIYFSNNSFGGNLTSITGSQNHDFFFQGTSATGYYALYGQIVCIAKHSPAVSNPMYRLYGNVRNTNLSLRVNQKGCFMHCIEVKA